MCAYKSLGVLAKIQILIWGLEWGLNFCISNKLLSDAAVVGPWNTL